MQLMLNSSNVLIVAEVISVTNASFCWEKDDEPVVQKYNITLLLVYSIVMYNFRINHHNKVGGS